MALLTVAVFAKLVSNNILHYELLLQHQLGKLFLLNLEFYLDPLTVRLRPYEVCVDQLDLLQPTNLAEKKCHQLL